MRVRTRRMPHVGTCNRNPLVGAVAAHLISRSGSLLKRGG